MRDTELIADDVFHSQSIASAIEALEEAVRDLEECDPTDLLLVHVDIRIEIKRKEQS